MDFQPRYCCVKFFSCCLAAELMRICYYNIKLYHALQSAQVIYDQPWSTAIFLFNLMHTLHLHKPYTFFVVVVVVAKTAVSMIPTCAGMGQNLHFVKQHQ